VGKCLFALFPTLGGAMPHKKQRPAVSWRALAATRAQQGSRVAGDDFRCYSQEPQSLAQLLAELPVPQLSVNWHTPSPHV